MLNHQRLKMRLQQMKAEPVAKNITPVRDQLHSLGVKSQGCSQKKEHITDAQLAEKLNATMLADGLLQIRTMQNMANPFLANMWMIKLNFFRIVHIAIKIAAISTRKRTG